MSEHEIQKLATNIIGSVDPSITDRERVLAAEVVKLYDQRSMWYRAYNKLEDGIRALIPDRHECDCE